MEGSRNELIASYSHVNDFHQEVQETMEGVYTEILHEQPGKSLTTFVIRQRTDNIQIAAEENKTNGHQDPALSHRLFRTLKIQDNYDMMVRTTFNVVSDLEGQDGVEVRILWKQMPVEYLPPLEIPPSDSDEESSDEDDIESISDSGLATEADVSGDSQENT